MSRRVISSVSMQASRVLSGVARPTFTSTSRIVRPAVVSQTIAKRSYHEKGTSEHQQEEVIQRQNTQEVCVGITTLTAPYSSRPLQQPSQCWLHEQE